MCILFQLLRSQVAYVLQISTQNCDFRQTYSLVKWMIRISIIDCPCIISLLCDFYLFKQEFEMVDITDNTFNR